MRHDRTTTRFGLLAGLFCLAQVGCTHNYYYGNAVPVCEAPLSAGAPVVASSVPYGSVCEIPTRVGGGTVVAAKPGRATTPITTQRPPAQVVISEPTRTPTRPRTSGLGWRGAREDSAATTRISGAYEDDSFVR